jgi:hypothetical protein
VAHLDLRARQSHPVRRRSCPRALDILSRFAGPAINPKYTGRDIDDIVTAIRKVYPRVMA